MSVTLDSHQNDTGKATYKTSNSTSTSTRPSVNSVSITGGANQTISGNYNTTLTSSSISAAAYDQFGVQWYQSPTWSTSADSLSTTSNAASVTLSSSTHSDHSSTVTASLGGKSASTTVTFKWKHRLTVAGTATGGTTNGTYDDYSGNTKSLNAGTKTGYTFSSWTKSGTGTLSSTTVTNPTWTWGNGDGTATANWTINSSTLSVNPNGGTWSSSTSTQNFTQNYNTTKTIANPTPPSGKHFTGWTLSSGANGSFSGTTYTFGPAKGVTDTLTANYANHTWNSGSITTQPTCTATGVKTYTCTYSGCGATYTETVAAQGHDFSAAAARVHSLNNGTHNWKCSRCSAYGKVDNGTQVVNGTVSCTYGNWSNNNATTHKHSCTVCGYTATANHTWDSGTVTTAPGCTTAGVKTYTCTATGCGATYTESVNANGHTAVHHAAVAATCEDVGNIEYWTCSVCGKYFSDAACTTEITQASTVIAATGHNWDYAHATFNWNGYACATATVVCTKDANHTTTVNTTVTSAITTTATCVTNGVKTYTAKFTVGSSNYTSTKTEDLGKDASNHTNLTHTARNEATCLAAGNIEYWYCSGCGKYYSDAAATTQIQQADTILAKKDHSYTGEVKNNNDGTHSFKCVNGCNQYGGTVSCNDTYGQWQTVTAATCAAAGVQERECSVCGYVQTGSIEIDPNNHTNLTHTAAKDATCLAAGNIEYWYCSGCNKYFSDAAATQQIQQGDTVIAKKDHAYTGEVRSDGDGINGTHSFKCVNGCNQYGNPTVHSWDEGTVTTGPSCTETGIRTFHCTVEGCTGTYTATEPVNAHSYTAETVKDEALKSAADCETPDTYWYSCAVCGKVEKDDSHTFTVGEALGHDWQYDAAVFNWNGYACATATVTCGRDANHKKTVETTVTDAITTTATCVVDGEKTYTAKFTADGHDYTDEKTENIGKNENNHANGLTPTARVEAQCEVAGNIAYWTCPDCHKIYSDANGSTMITQADTVIPATGHNYTGAIHNAGAGGHNYACVNPCGCGTYGVGTEKNAVEAHHMNEWHGNTATCEAPGTETRECTDECGYQETRDTTALGHDWDWANAEYVWNGYATCTATVTCLNDGSHTQQIVSSSVTSEVTTEATCKVEGEKTYTAHFANANLTAQTTTENIGLAPTNHKVALTKTEAKAPTCVAEGNNEYYYCPDCGKYFKDAAGTRPTTVEDETLAVVPTAHKLTKHTNAKAATCTETGLIDSWKCDYCGKIFDAASNGNEIQEEDTVVAIDAHNHPHALTEIPAVAATCSATGNNRYYQCPDCGKYFKDAQGQTDTTVADETLAIVSTAHKLTKFTNAKAATCTETGLIDSWKCDYCGKIFSDDQGNTEITEAQTVVAIDAHNHPHALTEIPAVAATCIAEGNNRYYQCPDCGGYFTDAQGKNDTTVAEQVTPIDPRNHDGHIEAIEAKAETCTEDGNSAYYHCTACDHYYNDLNATDPTTVEAHVIPAHGHNYDYTDVTYSWLNGNLQVRATAVCTYDGSHKITETVNTVKTEITPATCTAKGEAEYTATFTNAAQTIDGKQYTPVFEAQSLTAELPMLDHTLVKHDAATPTCVKGGNIAYYECSVCHKLFKDSIGYTEITAAETVLPIDPNAHDWDVWEEGTDTDHIRYCKLNHDHSETSAHQWSAWEVVTAATCGAAGQEKRTCYICNKEQTREIPKDLSKHVWGEWSETTAPTCENDGVETRECSVCHETETRPVAALGHLWNDGEVTKAATCSETGVKTYTCTRDNCGATKTEVIPIDPDAHSWNDGVITTPANCVETGIKTFTCLHNANHTKTEEVLINPANHKGPTELRNAKDATCTEKGYTGDLWCTACNTKIETGEEIALKAHTLTKTAEVPATCLEAGTKAYWTCSVCGKLFSDENGTTEIAEPETIAALGHDLVHHDAKAPTCTEIGWAAYDTCSRCDYTTYEEIAALGHDWDEGTVTTEPTCMAEGVKTFTCQREGCGATKTEVVAINANAHDWGEWTVKTPATCTTNGVEERVCSRNDNHKQTRTVDALGHDLKKVEAKAATCTEAGNVEYWHCDRCGANFAEAAGTTALDNVTVPATGHAWGEWTVTQEGDCVTPKIEQRVCSNNPTHIETKQTDPSGHTLEKVAKKDATCTEKGREEYYHCSVCDKNFSDVNARNEVTDLAALDIAALGHDPAEAVEENRVEAKCEEAGSYDSVVYCARCHAELSREHKTIDALGHDWDEPTYVWAADNSTVTATRVCKRDNSHTETETANVTTEVTKDPTCTEKGETTYTATFTNTAFETQTKVLADVDAKGHTPGEAVEENRVEADCTTVGGYDTVVYCTVCHEELSRAHTEIPATGHSLVKTEAVPSTCSVPGTAAYYTCETCHKLFKHDVGYVEITEPEALPLDPDNHVHTDGTDAWGEWQDKGSNVEHERECSECHAVEKAIHVWGDEIVITPATCTEDGSKYKVCTVCNYNSDHHETEVIPALGHKFPLTATAEVPATCTEAGVKAYFTCERCGAHFAASTGGEAIADFDTWKVIPAKNHAWGEPTYVWNADNTAVTATRVCGNDHSHVETETANVTKEITTPATCTEKGETTYTATFTNTAFATQTKVLEDVAALGHAWGEPTYVWSDDGKTCTATRICGNNEEHVETQTVNAVPAVTKAATCEEKGETTYTATFTNEAFAQQTKTIADIPATGHNWKYGEAEFNWNGYACANATVTCGNDETHKLTVDVTVTSETTPATCEADGSTVYTASFTANGKTYTDTKTEVIDKLNHDWDYANATFNWVGYGCANATVKCLNDETHKLTVDVTVTSETTDADCENAGQTVYTATFTANDKPYTDTKTEVLPATGHDWSAVTYTWADDNSTVTATRTCGNDAAHVETETVAVTAEVTTPATCEAKGKTTYTSAAFENEAFKVQTKVLEDVPALGHDWDYANAVFNWVGYGCANATVTCKNDGTHKLTVDVTVTSETTDADCENAGQTVYTATFTANDKPYTDTKTKELPATGHDWSAVTYTWADDNSTVTATRTCGNDASHVETETVAVTAEVTTPATCEVKGKTTYTSAAFENEAFKVQTKVLEDVPALGHDWDYANAVFNWSGYGCANATVTCKNDGTHKLTVNVEVTAVTTDPACEAAGKTDYTARFTADGETYTDTKTENLPAMGHSFPLTEHKGTEPTCIEAGVKTYYECGRCHKNFEDQAGETEITEAIETWKVIEALGHAPNAAVTENKVEATCTEHGTWDEIVYCGRCGEELSRTPKMEEALGHLPGPAVRENETPASCLTDGGYDTVTYCRRCEAELSREHTVLPATGHSFTRPIISNATRKSEATCTKAAVYYYTCANCDVIADTDAYTFIVGDPLGHTMETIAAVAPTCSATGNNLYYHCTCCDTYFSDIDGRNETTVEAQTIAIDPNAHAWGEWTVKTAATCTTEGEEIRVCGHNGDHVDSRVLPIDPDAHKPVIVEGQAPTCTEDGYAGKEICEYCGVTLREHETVPALGHDWSAWTVTTEATCTEAGVETRVCGRCQISETRPVAALGHTPVAIEELAATCTEAGHTGGVKCAVCGEILTPATVLRKLGHAYGEWIPVLNTNGTADETQHQRICANDPTHVLYAEHTWGAPKAQPAATCGTAGVNVYTCTVCGAEKRETVQPNGRHTWGAWTYDEATRTHTRSCVNAGCTAVDTAVACRFNSQVTTLPTFTTDGVVTYTCPVCGGTYTETVKASGMNLNRYQAQLEKDGTVELKAYILPGEVETLDGVTFKSSDENVATVDANGKVTAKNPGSAVITVTAGGFVKTCTVTVAGEPANYLRVTTGNLTTTNVPGTTIQLSCTLMPANADAGSVEWYSSNSAVASVTTDGLVTYNSEGTAIIYAKTKDGAAAGSITVRCTLNKNEVQNVDKTFSIHFVVTDSTYTLKNALLNNNVTVTYLAGSTVTFKVTRDVYVLINGVRQPKSADRTYTIESLNQNLTVMTSANENAGMEPENNGNNGASATDGNGSVGSGVCNYCGKVHTGFFGALVGFFHGIFYFFKTMFGR